MKKLPWGLIAGICGVIAFYTIAGTIAADYVLSAIAGATSDGASIFGTWYQRLLFACDIVFGLAFLGALALWIVKLVTRSKDKGEKTE